MSSASRPSGVEPVRLRPPPAPRPRAPGASFGMAEELVAELAGVAGARGDQRDALRAAEPRRSRSGTTSARRTASGSAASRRARVRSSRLAGPCTAMLWSWSVDSLTHTCRPEPLGLLAQPDAVVLVAADEAEVVVGRAGRRCRRRASRRSRCTSPCRRPGRSASRRMSRVIVALQQRLGVGPEDLELAQRREVHDRRLLAAGPVLGDRAVVVVAVGQPVAAVLGEPARSAPRCAGGTPVSLRELGLGVRRDAVRDRQSRTAPSAG